ncbi:hypothetical protein K435DRAFT_801462 [Dendrothele bispora CBS 962.96]|uniref:CxC2-like cysteine cluster KDZ transposase-associated domain-containing protein n=1 Tax=Dendrothele bispora (strain CBS 962.96) TaxID=1314807 RepID=A0A4S8LQE5_DENBC|nr:hypothetical protein K435DRAFT_801462 [Dendrothele bispora CBS 962.96]
MSLKRKKGFWSQTRVVRDPDAEDELLPPPAKIPILHTDYTNVSGPKKQVVQVTISPADFSLLSSQNPVTENQLSEPTKKSVSELNLVEEPGFDEEGNTFGWDWDGDSEDEEEEAIGQGEVGPGVKKRQARGNFYVLMDAIILCPRIPALIVLLPLFPLHIVAWVARTAASIVRLVWLGNMLRIHFIGFSSFFCRDTFHNLGFILLLGQTTGQICPCASLAPVKTLVALDVTGVHKLNILYYFSQDRCHLSSTRTFPSSEFRLEGFCLRVLLLPGAYEEWRMRGSVSSEAVDPSLNRGCAYIIDSRTALDHIRTFGKSIPDDISSCSNHKALKLACMRRDPGLAVTGLATTDCSRHDAKLPCSCTDLQAGERYANMDLTLCSTLQHTDVDHVIPKFHLSAHQEGCHLDFNLNYTPRVGTTDGEGVERGWAVTNTLASSTKVMGPGSRHDVLDDHFGSSNWIKRTMFPKQFLAWSKENSNGCEEAVTAFKLFNAGIPEKTRIEWRTALENWEEDPKCHPNPYEPMVKATTFNKVRLRLAEAEAHELGQSSTIDAVNQEASLSSLLIEGLDFRELQQKLSQELAGAINYTEQAKSKTLEKANSLRRRIDVWCSTQALHFPAAVVIRRLKVSHPTRSQKYPSSFHPNLIDMYLFPFPH